MPLSYLDDQYRKEWTTRVASVSDGRFVVLEESFFYPVGGGQPHDEGVLRRVGDGEEFRVVFVKKHDGGVSHEVDREGLSSGDEVEAVIDWDRRERLMRSHTAAHLVSALIHQRTGALITGNQLSLEKVRIDFSLEQFDPELFKEIIDAANERIVQGAPLSFSFVSREEALAEPSLARLAAGLPPSIKEIRVVEIEGIDRQACGGTHVKDLKEIGPLSFRKAENKGKQNRRLSFTLA